MAQSATIESPAITALLRLRISIGVPASDLGAPGLVQYINVTFFCIPSLYVLGGRCRWFSRLVFISGAVWLARDVTSRRVPDTVTDLANHMLTHHSHSGSSEISISSEKVLYWHGKWAGERERERDVVTHIKPQQ